MENKGKNFLLQKYMVMPEAELQEMLMQPESEYREGIFPLLIEAARTRGLYTDTNEIREHAAESQAAKQDAEQARETQPLSLILRWLFVIASGIAFIYWIFIPWERRKKEAWFYFNIGLYIRCVLSLCVLSYAKFFTDSPLSTDANLLYNFGVCFTACDTLYLFYLKKKLNTAYSTAS
jgi:hypothetical protein